MPHSTTKREFWRGKRVLVTGHTGFKGSWLSLWLEDLGAGVNGYALAPPTEPNLFTLAEVDRNIRSFRGDIRDLERLSQVVVTSAPEIIFHLAAQPIVRESFRDPVGTYATNVLGTVHLLESARNASSVRAIVIVTSDKCYAPQFDSLGYRETDPLGGDDPYSNSKGCAELVTAAYRHSYFKNGPAVASARAGNVIGGGDWAADRLLPDFIRAASARVPVRIRNTEAVRPWQHVIEPLSGYLLLAEKLFTEGHAFAEPWNFGPAEDDAIAVWRVIERAVEFWGEGASWQRDEGTHPPETKTLRLNCTKSQVRLGWRPVTNVETALRWTVDWYKRVQEGKNPRTLTLRQIGDYAKTLRDRSV